MYTALFSKTFEHPLALRGDVEWVPTEWLAQLANPQADTFGDTGDWHGTNDLLALDALFDDLMARGMRDPFIIGVGRVSRTCRLEAGNHRIQIFVQKQLPFVPAVVLVGDSAITSEGNGTHEFRRALSVPTGWPHFGPYPEECYVAPSAVFPELAQFRRAGVLPISFEGALRHVRPTQAQYFRARFQDFQLDDRFRSLVAHALAMALGRIDEGLYVFPDGSRLQPADDGLHLVH